jgi:hypothetical protein
MVDTATFLTILYVGVEKGVEGRATPAGWWQTDGAQVLCPPKRKRQTPWPQPWRCRLAGIRQSVATVSEKLFQPLRLDRERPHALSGFPARLAAQTARQNFCIWLNEPLGRPRLAFTDLVDW